MSQVEYGNIFILFFVILELENLKQDDVKTEADVKELRCNSGDVYCYFGTPVCIPSRWICDGMCDCGDCSDEPSICYAKGELDEKYLTRMNRMKEKHMTTAKCWLPFLSWPCSSDPEDPENPVSSTPAPDVENSTTTAPAPEG